MYGIEKAVRENLYFLVREGQIVAAIKYDDTGPVSLSVCSVLPMQYQLYLKFELILL